MALCALSSPFLPSIQTLNSNPNSSPSRLHFSISSSSPRRTITTSASSFSSRLAASDEEDAAARLRRSRSRSILEKYGIDPDNLKDVYGDDEDEDETYSRSKRRRGRMGEKEKGRKEEAKPPRTTHKLLQVIAGKARRRKLLSPTGMDVRPMMEVVKGAAFDIIQSAGGYPASLRPGRWLDLYSGTGSVGIEAISRGCSEAHFVEMDPWVISKVLRPNLESIGFVDASHIHMIRVESFLDHAQQSTGKDSPFDYISVTPPYTQVEYPTLMDQLAKSRLIGEDCFILVEYPLKTSMADSCGHLIKIADRRFGRTNLLIYGPKWAEKKRRPGKNLAKL